MIDRPSPSSRLAPAVAALAAAALALAACGRGPAPEQAAVPPPPAPPPEMMGAPDGAPPPADYAQGPQQPPPPSNGAPGYYGPPPAGYGQPGYPPPPSAPLPGYPAGTLYAAPGAALGPGTMAPIPNPTEQQRYARHGHREHRAYRVTGAYGYPHHHHRHAYRYATGPAAPAHAPRARHAHAPAPAPARASRHVDQPRHPTAPATRAPVHVARPAPAPTHPAPKVATRPHQPAPAPKAAPVPAAKPAVPTLRAPVAPVATSPHGRGRHHGRHETPPVAAAPSAEETAHLTALGAALAPVIASRAELTGAEALKVDQPGDVTLTVPPDFYDGLKNEAQRNGLGEAAASGRLVASLAGDGYAVQPSTAQTQPLTTSKPTEFRWTVTKAEDAKGPLHAAVGADLLGGGVRHVDLGGVDAKAGKGVALSPRVIGLSLLALIVVIIAALFAGGRTPRRPTGATRPRATHFNGDNRP